MEKTLTIVVPSYNVEMYLRQTLQSFVKESILPDIEVLIVDDGSKDGTAQIGKEYETRYPQSFRLISKKNGGHGSAVNKGIEECRGRYFKVVDGDDWVNTEDFVKLVDKLKSCQADYVVTNYFEVDNVTGDKTEKTFHMLKNDGHTPDAYRRFDDIAAKVQIPMHALVIRSPILKENKIRLDEHSFYVDVEYILYPVPYVQTVAYYDMFIYMYRLAQVTQSVSMQGYQKHIQNHIDVIMHLTDFAEQYRKKTQSKESAKLEYIGKRIAQMVGDQITIYMSYPAGDKSKKQEFIAFDEKLKQKSIWIYQLSGLESGTLRVLRRTGFKGYGLILSLARKRNGMEG